MFSEEDEPCERVLKQAGYVTGMAGKWRQMGGFVGEWGFDDYRMSDVAASPSQETSYTANGKHVAKPNGTFYPDLQQAFALEFLRRHRDEPFFFYDASHLVHDPIVATPDTVAGDARKVAATSRGDRTPIEHILEGLANWDKSLP